MIESIGTGEVLENLIPILKSIVVDGIVFVTPVSVAMNN